MAGFNPYAAAGVPTPTGSIGGALLTGLRGVKSFLDNPFVRQAAGAPQAQPGPYDAWLARPTAQQLLQAAQGERQGPPIPKRLLGSGGGAPPSSGADQNTGNLGRTPASSSSGTTPIVQASDDTYRQLLSQYGGAPGVEQLAMQTSLPTGFTPAGAKGPASLKDFYSAESQVGSRDIESIIPTLTQGLQGKDAENIATWAKTNPMLAQREYAKKMNANQAAASYGGYGPSDDAIRTAMSSGQYYPSQGSPSPIGTAPLNPVQGYSVPNSAVSPQASYDSRFGLNGNFGTPGAVDNSVIAGAANSVPAPPDEQSKADFNQRMAAIDWQKTYTNLGNTFPNFESYYNPQ